MTPTPDTTAFRKEIEAVLRSSRDLGLPPRRRLMDQAKNVSEFLSFLLFNWKPGPGGRKVMKPRPEDVHREP